MRRKDREVTELVKIKEIIDKSEIIRIGYYDEGEIYIVPVNFAYTEENGKYTFYFHGASAGRKFELSKNGCRVGFELENSTKIVLDDKSSCLSSCLFRSAIGSGKISLITNPQEKERYLNLIMSRFTGKKEHFFEKTMLEKTAVFKLEAEKLSCKEKIK